MKRKPLSHKRGKLYFTRMVDRIMQPFVRPDFLISGYWRSGTTWVHEAVADALQAKTIFEPLSAGNHPPFLENFPLHPAEAKFPCSPAEFSSADEKFLDRAFHGYCPYRFAYYARYDPATAFKTKSLVKVIRAHFILDYFIERYNVKVIHIVRHPCAVVNSFQYTKWPWSFDDVTFSNLYPDAVELHKFDASPSYEKIAAFWAYCEKHVRDGENIKIFFYEDLVLNRMKSLFDYVGAQASQIDQASFVSAQGREDLDKEARVHSWQGSLPVEQQERILEIVNDIAPDVKYAR